MPHSSPLVTTIVAAIGLAFLFGALANRLRMPPLVGYLLAGIAVGPFTPGYVADQTLAPELAEIGIILLMFGVGLHFSLKDLLSVGKLAIPGALAQIAVASLMGFGLAHVLGWSLAGGLVFGLALSVASTVVLLRALQDRRLLDSERGRIAVGWLVVEDIAMVLVLVLLPAFAGTAGSQTPPAPDWIADRIHLGVTGIIFITMAKVVAFIGVMMVVGRRIIPWILHAIAQRGSRELFRLAVLAIALCVAFGAAQLFGVSLALGGFFAGMVLSESELSHQAAQDTLPLRDAFAVLFFVSVGMLFDPSILLHDPLAVLATLAIILFGKSVASFLIVLLFRHPIATALTISASLAQIGEFSFILAELGVGLGLFPERGRSLILAGAILSIMVNPLVFAIIGRVARRLESRAENTTKESTKIVVKKPLPPDLPMTMLTGHVVLIGFGRVGSLVGPVVQQQGIPLVVIEDADQTVTQIRKAGFEVISGNAANPEVLRAANLVQARHLVVAIPNAFEAGQVITQARSASSTIHIVARAHSDAEVEHLTAMGADQVIMGEREIARGIAESLISSPSPS
ncbi:YbaL family putative K(+) efflux transporter [Telmatospirillum sp.]|uniref:YbaL family putative K(+) efflux transporter n=1 Tax=Telmatospirillum sp. TaxID=2079197 RepID=UPI00284FFB32|nr:YbaL family putative K(+) efflux transporter [Telmatospirillum sp.]MDR3437897.1 YbaL family putative K(+) efflux transporter [Telmatospirillum sp.]